MVRNGVSCTDMVCVVEQRETHWQRLHHYGCVAFQSFTGGSLVSSSLVSICTVATGLDVATTTTSASDLDSHAEIFSCVRRARLGFGRLVDGPVPALLSLVHNAVHWIYDERLEGGQRQDHYTPTRTVRMHW